jgi:hypothetical protein
MGKSTDIVGIAQETPDSDGIAMVMSPFAYAGA